MTNKQTFKTRFKELFPELRLLAIQLNGFSHKAYYDNGNKQSGIQSYEFSNYLSSVEIDDHSTNNKFKSLFSGFSHYSFQNNAVEIVYITPEKR
jgi:hypothetical protein